MEHTNFYESRTIKTRLHLIYQETRLLPYDPDDRWNVSLKPLKSVHRAFYQSFLCLENGCNVSWTPTCVRKTTHNNNNRNTLCCVERATLLLHIHMSYTSTFFFFSPPTIIFLFPVFGSRRPMRVTVWTGLPGYDASGNNNNKMLFLPWTTNLRSSLWLQAPVVWMRSKSNCTLCSKVAFIEHRCLSGVRSCPVGTQIGSIFSICLPEDSVGVVSPFSFWPKRSKEPNTYLPSVVIEPLSNSYKTSRFKTAPLQSLIKQNIRVPPTLKYQIKKVERGVKR